MENLINSLLYLTNFWPFFLLFFGVTLGILVGSIPGLTTTMLITLTLPLTFFMDSVNAITLMTEYIRMEYPKDYSAATSRRIEKICTGLLSMENCNQKQIVDTVCKTECKLLDEAMDHMIGLKGIEMSLLLKESHFDRVRKKADKLMDICTAKKVISNGAD